MAEKPQKLSPQQEADIYDQLSAVPIQTFVFNGNINRVSASEISSIVTFNGRPLALLIMPPVMAKALAQDLLKAVEFYEGATGQTLPDYHEANVALHIDR